VEIALRTFSYFVYRKAHRLSITSSKIWPLLIHYLHKHNELCLAGLGRFVAETSEFHVDPVSKKIYPASRKIYFQSGEFENSTEFLAFAASLNKSTHETFVDKLAQFAEALQGEVKELNRLEIEHFGTFKLNVMGELDFESTKGDLFDENSFGLKPVHFAANLLKTKRIIVEQEDDKEEDELTQLRESSLKELKILLDQARIAESSKEQKSSKIFPVVATVLTIILLVNLGFFLFNGPVDEIKNQISQMSFFGNTAEIIDTQITHSSASKVAEKVNEIPAPIAPIEAPVDTATIQNSVPATIVEPTQKVEVEKPIANVPVEEAQVIPTAPAGFMSAYQKGIFDFDSTFYSEPVLVQTETQTTETSLNTPAEETAKPIVVDNTAPNYDEPNMVNVDAAQQGIDRGFYVIAGAFKNETNANKLKVKLQQSGDSQSVVFKPAYYPYYLVAYKNSPNLNQALSLMEQKQAKQPSVWVYCAF
jgi:cell division septation protein DedD